MVVMVTLVVKHVTCVLKIERNPCSLNPRSSPLTLSSEALEIPLCVCVCVCVFFLFFFCVPQLYLWGSPLLGEIIAYVTVF